MSHKLRRKHVLKEMMDDDYELPKEQQQIVRVVSSRGNNLHEVQTADDNPEHFLVSMPKKYRKNVWVKRGDYVLIEPIDEGGKVKAEMCRILTTEHIKEYEKAGIWPENFRRKHPVKSIKPLNNEELDSDDLLTPNTNRPVFDHGNYDDDDSDESSTEN